MKRKGYSGSKTVVCEKQIEMPLGAVSSFRPLALLPLAPDTPRGQPATLVTTSAHEDLLVLQSRARWAIKTAVGLQIALTGTLVSLMVAIESAARTPFEHSAALAAAALIVAVMALFFGGRHARLQLWIANLAIVAFVLIIVLCAWRYSESRHPDAAAAKIQCFADLASNLKEESEAERDLARCLEGVAVEQFALEREALRNKNPALDQMRNQLAKRCTAQQKWIDGVYRRRKTIEARGCSVP